MSRLLCIAFSIALTLPAAAQDWARAKLEQSSRHQEWVEVRHGGRVVHAFVVYPEAEEKRPAVVVIHENRGLTDWVRSMADELAEAGYVAIAPDLLSGMAPGGGRTSDFADSDAAREAIYKLDPDSVTADLNAVANYVSQLPAGNGRVTVAGFCWGGSQTFRFATNRRDLAAAFVFYGSGPEEVSGIQAPVYGFYGGNDERVNATIPATEEKMKAQGKKYEPVTYAGAGHGFMRSGEAPGTSEADRQAREQAWARWMALLNEIAPSKAQSSVEGVLTDCFAGQIIRAASVDVYAFDPVSGSVPRILKEMHNRQDSQSQEEWTEFFGLWERLVEAVQNEKNLAHTVSDSEGHYFLGGLPADPEVLVLAIAEREDTPTYYSYKIESVAEGETRVDLDMNWGDTCVAGTGRVP